MLKKTFLLLGLTSFLFNGCGYKNVQQKEKKIQKIQKTNWKFDSFNESTVKLFQLEKKNELFYYLFQVSKNNPDLKSMSATIKGLSETEKATKASSRPTINAQLTSTRTKDKTLEPQITNEISANIGVSWTLDIWGKMADETQAAKLRTQQEKFNYLHGKRLLLSQAINYWISFVEVQQEIKIILDLEKNAINNINSTQEDYQNSLSSYSDLTDAKTTLSKIRMNKEDLILKKKILLFKLNILRGYEPSANFNIPKSHLSALLLELPKEISSTSLLERPDIQSSFKELQILDKETSASYKALLPQINISTSLSRSGSSSKDILSGNTIWQLVGGITQPIFNSGALEAIAKNKSAEAESSLWNYRKTVLTALEELETSLATNKNLQNKHLIKKREFIEKTKALAFTEDNFANGQATLFEVISAKSDFLESKYQLKNSQATLLKSRINIALAIGYPFEKLPKEKK
ncbi:MAG: TolC family protein [Campylobacterales bacterium]|nr:TolC family protein [Campylobacterales bacterium]